MQKRGNKKTIFILVGAVFIVLFIFLNYSKPRESAPRGDITCYNDDDCPVQYATLCNNPFRCNSTNFYRCENPGNITSRCIHDHYVLGICEFCREGCFANQTGECQESSCKGGIITCMNNSGCPVISGKSYCDSYSNNNSIVKNSCSIFTDTRCGPLNTTSFPNICINDRDRISCVPCPFGCDQESGLCINDPLLNGSDLIIVAINVSIIEESVNLTIFVRNNGYVDSGPSTTRIFFSEYNYVNVWTPPLPALLTFPLRNSFTLASGTTQEIIITADFLNEVPEVYEDNNIFRRLITVPPEN